MTKQEYFATTTTVPISFRIRGDEGSSIYNGRHPLVAHYELGKQHRENCLSTWTELPFIDYHKKRNFVLIQWILNTGSSWRETRTTTWALSTPQITTIVCIDVQGALQSLLQGRAHSKTSCVRICIRRNLTIYGKRSLQRYPRRTTYFHERSSMRLWTATTISLDCITKMTSRIKDLTQITSKSRPWRMHAHGSTKSIMNLVNLIFWSNFKSMSMLFSFESSESIWTRMTPQELF